MSIAVFASGSGSNFVRMVETSTIEQWPQSIRLLVCDQPSASVIQKAKNHQIQTHVFSPSHYQSKTEYEEEILQKLNQLSIQWIVLAGYMRLVGSTLLEAYAGRIVNIHPSLLPAFPGKYAIEQALENGVKQTGVTVHFVDAGMDTGPIIAQRAVSVAEEETVASLQKKIQAVEHRLYPEVVYQLITGQIRQPHHVKE